jgi:hypothetical protein
MGLRTDRSILYIIYWAINLIIAVTNVDLTTLNDVSLYHSPFSLG